MEPRIVLVGAGSSEFGFNSVLDSANIETLRGSNLVLHDINQGRLERMGLLAERIARETESGRKSMITGPSMGSFTGN